MRSTGQTIHKDRPRDNTSTARFFIRVLGLGSLLIVLDCYWIVAAENRVVWELTDFSFFPTVLFTLFSLTLLNLAVQRLAPRAALTSIELATIYVMVSVATALAGHDIVRQLVPLIGNGTWYATPENEWIDLFGSHLPSWLTISNRDILQNYYEPEGTFWVRSIIDAWITPFFAWAAFVVALLVVMLCVNIVLRKQWTEHERLNYPIAQLPIEMFGDSRKFFSARLMWIGFALAFGLELLAGLSYLYPALPALKLKYNLSAYFREKPWSGMGGLAIYVYPFAIGLGYLMPLDLSFSLWVFYLVWKIQFVALTAFGLPSGGDAAFRAGAWIAIGLLGIWTSRRHIGRVLRGLFSNNGAEGDDNDPIYRLAAFGFVGGAIFILAFCRLAGMELWVAALYFTIYLVLCIAMTRMRAEVGPPTHELHGMHPDALMVMFTGARPIGPRNLSATTMFSWLAYGYRCHPMPHQMEGFKIGSALNIRSRRLIAAMVVAGVVGAFVAIGAHIVLYHQYRYARWGVGEFGRLANWIGVPRGPDIGNIYRVVIGFTAAVCLTILKRGFMWWPLYPVGYAVGYGWAMGWMWFSIFLGWAAKRTLFSTGGIGSYRKALPLFLGFIFGQFLSGSLWSLIGAMTGRNMYTLFP